MWTRLFKESLAGFILTLAIWSYQSGRLETPQICIGVLHDAAVFTNGLK